MSIHRAAVIVAVALLLAAPGRAAAQAPEAPHEPESEALTLGEEGLKRFHAARWQEAHDLFRRANDAAHAPTLVLYMAHCQVRLGDLAAAHRLYRAVTREHLAADAPLQFRTAQRMAAQELRWIEPRLAPVKVVLAGVPEGQARLRVDGAEVPSAQIDDLALEPGAHVVEASIPGGAVIRRTITTAVGKGAAVVLVFDAPAPVAGSPPAPRAPAVPPPAPGGLGLVGGAGIAFGAGGVALLAGLVAGVSSLRASAEVRGRCDSSGHCLISDQGNAAMAGKLADVATGTLVTGAVAVAAGVVLVIVHARAPAWASSGRVRAIPGLAGGVF